MNSDLTDRFKRAATLFPHMLDVATDQILLSHMSEDGYKTASFLDQRLLKPNLSRQTIARRALPVDITGWAAPHYIFHVGHVGSTLISRLLGELPTVLALREPLLLRDLAEISQIRFQPHSPWSPLAYETRRDQIILWLSRTFRPNQRSMVKASSFASEIALELIGPQTKALFLYVPIEVYLKTILAGDGSRQEALKLAAPRFQRLHARIGEPIGHLWDLTFVQKVALGWLTEIVCLWQTFQSKPTNIRWQNFDDFLEEPANEIVEIADHFDLAMSKSVASTLVNGPIMRTYSKAPEHDYSSQLRQDLLMQSQRQFGPQISAGVKWIVDLSKKSPLIAEIINFTEETDV
jgi:hypothetical protein